MSITAQSGKEVRYTDLPEAEYAEALKAHGAPELIAHMVAETDAATAHGAYRIVQESLTNVLRHSNAQRAVVHVELIDDRLTVEVLDDGHVAAPGRRS